MFSKSNIAIAIAIVALIFAGYGMVGDNQSDQDLGGTRFPSGISADSTTPSAGQVRGTTQTFTGASTLTSGTFSSTLGVTGVTTLDGETLASLFTQGGATTSSSTPASMTLATTDVCDNNILEITPTVGSITLTFPTATQLIADCIPNIGDEREFWMRNASSTGTAVITIADGAGGIHLEGETLTTLIDNSEWGQISLINVDGTNYVLDVEIRQDAD
jgi:hypothetical protein